MALVVSALVTLARQPIQAPVSARSAVPSVDRRAAPTETAVQSEPMVGGPASAPASRPRGDRSALSPERVLAPVLDEVPGNSGRVGAGRLVTYAVEVQRGLLSDPEAFAQQVECILFASRSWTATGRVALQRVPARRAQLRVTLAAPDLVDRYCRPLSTQGRYSCFNGDRAMINSTRWSRGAAAYGDDLADYRTYVINHEVGHALGNRHATCPGPGRRAPVMLQQTIGTQGCRPNFWPYPGASAR